MIFIAAVTQDSVKKIVLFNAVHYERSTGEREALADLNDNESDQNWP